MNDTLIDLRSDTVTRPTDSMRAAMAAAPVGDDQYGEDPTNNLLQERVAALLGKEAALWLPSGTMSNQVALRVLTRPGDEVISSHESHSGWHETGGAAANAGVQLIEVGAGGIFTREQFEAAIKPSGLPVFPPAHHAGADRKHTQPRWWAGVSTIRGVAHLRRGTSTRHGQFSRRRALVERQRGQRLERGRACRAV